MTVACNKCGGSRFELAQVSLENTQQCTILHCTACGQSLGISEIEAIRMILREQQSSLNELKSLLNDVREKLGKTNASR
jgi:transcription elongation factor Elf1